MKYIFLKLTVITKVINKYNFSNQFCWSSVQNTVKIIMVKMLIKCSLTKTRNKYLFTVLNKADLASLWKVMMTLVAGRLLEYFTLEQLQDLKNESHINAWKIILVRGSPQVGMNYLACLVSGIDLSLESWSLAWRLKPFSSNGSWWIFFPLTYSFSSKFIVLALSSASL
jgi:hypothetical protein